MHTMYPYRLDITDNKISLQSLLFGHRIKPNQTLYEYLIEFLIVVMSRKKINEQEYPDMFPVNDKIIGNKIEYMLVSNMGLKRFIFFENSRIDTRAKIDKDAYHRCRELISEHIVNVEYSKEDCIFILQNVLYGFSVENAGRSWFVKTLLPVCAEVLFPEALGKQSLRQGITLDDEDKIDNKFEYNSYTYMCRGGEVYYLHLLHALNAYPDRKSAFEMKFERMLNSMPKIAQLSKFIQEVWSNEMNIDDSAVIHKTLGAIPDSFGIRDEFTVSELECFLSCKIEPMEKLDIFSYGMLLQMLRMMFSAAKDYGNVMWILDMGNDSQSEHSEIRKFCAASYVQNEESVIKYLHDGLERYFGREEQDKKEKRLKDAETDSYKLFRKLAKRIGILIPLNGGNMRFTLSEEIIKFLVISLIPAGNKVTFDQFLNMMYTHFNMIVTAEHYHQARSEKKAELGNDVTFMNVNKTAFAQKLKDCGFLRDLSDATAIVENPYESEA